MRVRVINFYNEEIFDEPLDLSTAYGEVVSGAKREWVSKRAMEVAREIYASVSGGAIVIPWISSMIYGELTRKKGQRMIMVSSRGRKKRDFVQDHVGTWYEDSKLDFFLDERAFLTLEGGAASVGRITPLYIGKLPQEVEELAKRYGGPFAVVGEYGKDLEEDSIKSLKEVIEKITDEAEFGAWSYLTEKEKEEGGSDFLFVRVSDKTLSPWEGEDWREVAEGVVRVMDRLKVKRLGGACFMPGPGRVEAAKRPKLRTKFILSFKAEGLREKETVVLVYPITVEEFGRPSGGRGMKIALYEVFSVYEVEDWRAMTDMVAIVPQDEAGGSSLVAITSEDGHIERGMKSRIKMLQSGESRKLSIGVAQGLNISSKVSDIVVYDRGVRRMSPERRNIVKGKVEFSFRELLEVEEIIRTGRLGEGRVPTRESFFWKEMMEKVSSDIENAKRLLDILEGKVVVEEEIEELRKIEKSLLSKSSPGPWERVRRMAEAEVCVEGRPIKAIASPYDKKPGAIGAWKLEAIEVWELAKVAKIASLEHTLDRLVNMLKSSEGTEVTPVLISIAAEVGGDYAQGRLAGASVKVDYHEIRQWRTEGNEWTAYTEFKGKGQVSVSRG